ncbi:hypothetical protein [Nocardioides pantholopis]|uniref:hypothetical protein n=1 Tax=Nocardioides pantholopis TaxID=2483798 RepID=UPI000FDAEC5C|nr:hypothetical protein [Nocardioides pantholopis]
MSTDTTSQPPYTAEKPPLPETSDQLRARIPGWGADLDPADRPSYPRERFDPGATGAHWELPEQQEERWPRERSIEHARLTPVFGTSCPPKGLSGALRKYAYRRHSEAKAAHWLILLAADRVDMVESAVASAARGRPDNPIAETGIRAEISGHGLSSRLGRNRTDVGHHALDPIVVAGPWVAGAAGTAYLLRRVARHRRR